MRAFAYLLLSIFCLLSWPTGIEAAGSAAPLRAVVEAPRREEPLNFAQCVRLAIEQSPFFASSALEIDVRRLDESDSRYGFIPPVSLRTRYFVNRPNDRYENSEPYSISFVTDYYNPVESYYTLEARKVMTQMAVLAHLQVISDFIQRLALGFLEVDSLDQLEAYQEEAIVLAQQNCDYVTNRLETGGVSLLESRLAFQEKALAGVEKERLQSSKRVALEGMKTLLGLQDSQAFNPDTENAARQILNSFDPANVTLADAQTNSFELKTQNLKQELQKLNVRLAYARFLPSLFFGLENPDPLSRIDNKGLYFSAGVQLPLWDGFKRPHNVTRQKTILQQYLVETRLKDIDLATKWKTASEKLKNATADLELVQVQEQLINLKREQSEINYRAGSITFQKLLASRKEQLEARKNIVLKVLEKDKAALSLRHLSGDLQKAYVVPNPS